MLRATTFDKSSVDAGHIGKLLVNLNSQVHKRVILEVNITDTKGTIEIDLLAGPQVHSVDAFDKVVCELQLRHLQKHASTTTTGVVEVVAAHLATGSTLALKLHEVVLQLCDGWK